MQNRITISESLVFFDIWQGPFRNGSPWRGLFEPSTAPFRYERERVLEDIKENKTFFHFATASSVFYLSLNNCCCIGKSANKSIMPSTPQEMSSPSPTVSTRYQ